ncbi:putative GPI-anchored cupredoxin, partial [Lachnellula occidentalis]
MILSSSIWALIILAIVAASKMLLICLAFTFTSLVRLGRTQGATTSFPAVPTHTISVGAAGFVFTPDMVIANVGDIVEYRFYPQNHSVARADFKSPCIPYEYSGPGRVGFWGGFHPLNVIPPQPPFFQVQINDTAPIFFYCSAPGACIDDEMVGVINPNDTQTLDIQKAYAKNATIAFSPGESFPIESASSRSSSVPTSIFSSPSSGTTATDTATTTPTSTPTAAAAASKPPLSGGAIVGIVLGGAVVLFLVGASIYLCGRQRTLDTLEEFVQHNMQHATPAYMPGHLSLASATTYPPTTPKFDVHAPGGRRYSGQAGVFEHSATETKNYPTGSPLLDDGKELVIPNMHLAGSSVDSSPGSLSSGASPLNRRPIPDRPSSVSLLEETMYQPQDAAVPAELRVDMQNGPHELDVGSGRDYNPHPYNGPEYNPSPSSEYRQGRHL